MATEVWNILTSRHIKNVILTGVHTNMCVLGRPFGLRQMARNGKNVVLMRDMTDTMYNPKRWPYVSHFEGTQTHHLSHRAIRLPNHHQRSIDWRRTVSIRRRFGGAATPRTRRPIRISTGQLCPCPSPRINTSSADGSRWYRCVVRIPKDWLDEKISLKCPGSDSPRAWFNGHELQGRSKTSGVTSFTIPTDQVEADDANLIVLQLRDRSAQPLPRIAGGLEQADAGGKLAIAIGDDSAFSQMPLPAKFGTPTDIVFAPEDPLWTPRAVTRAGEFTDGIEGPACDRDGNVFAVNYARQGTIGRVRPNGRAEVFVELPAGSIGNGIRFAPDGSFFVADYTRHNVLRVDPASREVTVHAHHPGDEPAQRFGTGTRRKDSVRQ